MGQKVVGSYPTRHPINKYPRFKKAIGKVTYSNGNARDGSQVKSYTSWERKIINMFVSHATPAN